MGKTYVYWLLGSSVRKQAHRDGGRNPFPACQHRRVGVESDVITSILMLERRNAHVREKLLVWLVFLSLSSASWMAAWIHSPLTLLVGPHRS